MKQRPVEHEKLVRIELRRRLRRGGGVEALDEVGHRRYRLHAL
jgi:hypothetical protein